MAKRIPEAILMTATRIAVTGARRVPAQAVDCPPTNSTVARPTDNATRNLERLFMQGP